MNLRVSHARAPWLWLWLWLWLWRWLCRNDELGARASSEPLMHARLEIQRMPRPPPPHQRCGGAESQPRLTRSPRHQRLAGSTEFLHRRDIAREFRLTHREAKRHHAAPRD
ncbi:MAG: hypothetical protein ACK559_32945, partial [bacterium]